MSTQPKRYLTPQEYLAIERKAEFKSEYYDGEMFAMAGASEQHESILHNLDFLLGLQLRERACKVYGANMKVLVQQTGLYAYPDLTVVCGKPEFSDTWRDILLNPDVVIEVLSESTEKYDRGTKFHHYQNIPWLKEYILVSQEHMRIEHFVRQPDGQWLYSEATEPESSVVLPAIDCTLNVKEVYHKVEFEK